jgi:hypothetical protein
VSSVLDDGPALLTLHAEVVTAAPPGTSNRQVEAAVVWAALAPAVEQCLEAARTPDQVLQCTGADFHPRLTSMSVPVQPSFPAAFELPLHGPPPREALGGGGFGYGLLAVLYDGNQNHALDLVPPEATFGPDQLLGTSLRAQSGVEGDYLGWREGPVAPAWNAFRVLAGCAEPPAGFFLMRLFKVGDALGCTLESPDAPLTIELAATAQVRAHVCQYAAAPEPLPPPEAPPPQGSQVQCWGPSSIEVVREPLATCRRVERYDLSGGTAPAWWPCAVDATVLELTDAPGGLTAAEDLLFTLQYRQGAGVFRLKDLRIAVGSVVLSTLDSTVIVGKPSFVLVDRNADGLFSTGDGLEVSESEQQMISPAAPVPHEVRVWAESDGRVTALGGGLSWSP